MKALLLVLVGLAALAFILAVLSSLFGFRLVGTSPEGYSRACTNLALLAIGLRMIFKDSMDPLPME